MHAANGVWYATDLWSLISAFPQLLAYCGRAVPTTVESARDGHREAASKCRTKRAVEDISEYIRNLGQTTNYKDQRSSFRCNGGSVKPSGNWIVKATCKLGLWSSISFLTLSVQNLYDKQPGIREFAKQNWNWNEQGESVEWWVREPSVDRIGQCTVGRRVNGTRRCSGWRDER